MNSKRKIVTVLFIAAMLLFLVYQMLNKPTGEWVEKNEFVLGTFSQIRVYAPSQTEGEAIIQKAFDRVREIENRMSSHIETSQVYEINQEAGISSVEVTDDTLKVIQNGIDYYDETQGLFHIGIGSLIELWGIGSEHPYIPTQSEIEEKLEYLDIHAIQIQGNHVQLMNPQMSLDLGGIAKGYAVDESARILQEEGIQSGFINFGGDVYALGDKPDETPWNVGIREPVIESGSVLGRIPSTNVSVVTSGDYERYSIKEDTVYHHILDPRTGYPSQSGLSSVTIVSDTSIAGDVYSTAAFIMGLDAGLQLIEAAENIEGIFVNHQKEIFLSSGLQNNGFELMNDDYQILEN